MTWTGTYIDARIEYYRERMKTVLNGEPFVWTIGHFPSFVCKSMFCCVVLNSDHVFPLDYLHPCQQS